jgi:DHA1 family bicyclomycin/chloramphenicol resistance-like MFS transporter
MSKFLKKESPQLLFLLAAFVALGPLSTDMYLPALPNLVDAFDAPIAQVQFTLSIYLAGFSFFHLFCGPLSDRFGRRPVLLCGMLIFFIASLGCSQSVTVGQLSFWRFIQGIGACVGPTLARAMVRDIYEPLKLPKALATMNAIMALAPVIAPIIGGLMLLFLPWTSIFVFLALYSLWAALMVIKNVPESLPEAQSIRPANIVKNYLLLLSNSRFLIAVLAASFLYAGAFAFVSGSSFILIDFMQVPTEKFGLWFAFIVVGYFLGNMFTVRYSSHFNAQSLMLSGALLALIAGLTMTLLCVLKIYHPLSIVLPIALYTGAIGISLPQAMATALEPFAEIAGTASALMGFIQMGAASIAAAIVGTFLTGEPTPLALTLTGCGSLSFILFYRLTKLKR